MSFMKKDKKTPVKKAAPKKVVKKTATKKTPAKKTTKKSRPQAPGFRPLRKIVLPLIIGIFLPVLIYGLIVINSLFFAPVIFEDKMFEIRPGATVTGVARDLGQGRDFKMFVRWNGGVIKAGLYDIPKGASVWRLARIFTKGQVAQTTVMVPEGLTVRQVVNLLNAHPHLSGEITEIRHVEGQLFPDTYIVPRGMDRNAVLDMKARQMTRRLAQFQDAEFPHPLRDWNEVLTLASIVQKETSLKSEMPKVASVYLNRLNARPRMRLQADPTVVFFLTSGLGDMQGRRLLSRHLQTPHPFNTYRNFGLPPAPIANVGMDAIRAVLNPADTQYLFFVADGRGGHNFSRTYQQHNIYRRAWQEHRRANGI